MTRPALACRDLIAGYAGQAVVHGLTVEVGAGEIVALLGPNGAGKTTTLLTLAGLLPTLGGDIETDGAGPKSHGRRSANRHVALVPDDRALFTTLSVTDNLRVACRASELDLESVYTQFPSLGARRRLAAGLLSGGEQQMLALARALVRRPRLLLIDEMSMGLAPAALDQLVPVVRRAARQDGAGVLLVEQHVAVALALADRAVVLVHGDVVLEASTADLRRDLGRLETAYFGNNMAKDI